MKILSVTNMLVHKKSWNKQVEWILCYVETNVMQIEAIPLGRVSKSGIEFSHTQTRTNTHTHTMV